jgi:UDP-3-O-[3-hydroxymyristoyl] N-acetylglucosamine deacetylase
VNCTGIGLHTGDKINLTVRPASSGTGIIFKRTDLTGQPTVKAHYNNVIETMLATTIGCNGCRISTIEHLMAAFYGVGIDNAIVELDGPEVPIMDGSSAPFVFLIKDAGIKKQKSYRKFIVIKKPFFVEDGNRSVAIYPSKELKITYLIDFEHPLLKNQEYELSFSGRNFEMEISTARTFGFLKDLQMLKENGLAKGGSLDNAIVVDEFRVLNEDGLRFEDEFVRHKILDFIGDVSVVGSPIIGHFVIKRSGHSLNHLMLNELIKSKKHWKSLTFDTNQGCVRNKMETPGFGMPEPLPA